jgi:RNA polymerase sigma-70 factor (ECF subfamily)
MNSPENILATRTTTKLLDSLHDRSNELVWEQIDARYRPVVAALARRLGLSVSEADEVAQQTLSEFVRAYREGRYDRTKGRLSSWIMGIAHHTALRAQRAAGRDAAPMGTHLESVCDEHSLRGMWTEERDRLILGRALASLRDDSNIDDRTFLAFELVGLRGVPASEAAAQSGMSVEQVYVAKSRLTKRLREQVELLTRAFEEDE